MILRAGWAALLLAAGATQLATGWAGWLPIVVLVLAAAIPIGLTSLVIRFRLPVGLSVSTLVGLTALGAYLATASTGAGLVTALTDAVPRLLTAPRPAPATADLLMPGALLTVLIGLWCGIAVCRERPALIAPPIGAAVLYTSAALLTAGQADPYGLAAGGVLLLTVAGWTLLDRPGRRSVSARPIVAAMACCAGVALLAGALPMTGGFEPRRLVQPPSVRLTEPSPLPRLAAWAQQGDVELLRVRGEPRPLRLVALNEYTGASWRASGTYRPLGTVDKASLPDGQRRGTAETEVVVAGLEGPWLPSAGEPTTVSLNDIAVDPESGSTTVKGGLRAGLRYRMRCELDQGRAQDVATAAVPDETTANPYLATPSLPWQLAEYARRSTHNANTPYEQAVALEFIVRSGRRFDPTVPTGSSYARLTTFLFGTDGTPGAQAGSSEQFATAFAVLARAVRLPTRIVVGFRAGDRAEDGTAVVRGRHAVAWPEVYFTGWGWLPFDPTPRSGAVTSADSTDTAIKQQVLARLAQRATAPIEPAAPTATPPVPTPAPAPANASGPGIAWPPALVVALAVTVLGLPLLVLAGGRAARRARHRRAGPQGAWSEVLDLLVVLGRPAPRWQPAPEVATTLAAHLPVATAGPHPAIQLAAAADQAAFAPEPPRADPQAWRELRLLRHAARRTTPWYRQLLWPFDPRPLRRR